MFEESTVYHSGMRYSGNGALRFLGFTLACVPLCMGAGTGASIVKSIRESGLDPAECYRVREINIVRDEAQFYLTDGYLIFGRRIGDAASSPVTAVFTTEVEGGEAELLLLPPNRAERHSLARHTDTPNMEEHFDASVFVFADSTYREVMEQIRANPYIKKSPEMGLVLSDKWSSVAKNVGGSFGLRLALDLMSPEANRKGFFAAAISGKKLGAFDVVFDPRAREQMVAGQGIASGFDIWTSFIARSFRNRKFEPEFKLSDYRIQTEFDADLNMHCITRVKLETRSGGEGALPFEITRQMQVTGATINGEPAELITNQISRASLEGAYGNDLFLVAPASPLVAGKTYELEIRHQGKVVADAGNHVYFVGARGTWYPGRGMQFAKYELTFRCPRDLDLVASGDLLEDRVEGAQRVVRRTVSTPVRLAGFNLGVYEKTRIQRGDLKIEVCANKSLEHALQPKSVPPEAFSSTNPPVRRPRSSGPADSLPGLGPQLASSTSHLQSLAADVADVMDFYAARFGPAPIRTLEVSPVPGRFGQGFPGLIYLSTLSYAQPAGMDSHAQVFFTDLLHAHEAAHQWWGNVVTSGAYHDDWIMEALANYSALMFLEKKKGPRVLETFLDDYRERLLARSADGTTVESAGPVVDGARVDGDWNAVLYGKGTWIIHMLRRRMGDEGFLKMLAGLRRTYEDKTLSTDEFRQFCSGFLPAKGTDPKLESFFDQWVYGTGIPELKMRYSVKGAAPAWKITGTVTQTGVEDDFTADVPVEIQMGRLKPVLLTVRASDEPADFSATAKALPTKVFIDRHGILSK